MKTIAPPGHDFYGTEAERVAFTPLSAGVTFVETDTGNYYLWDGAIWRYVGGTGGLPLLLPGQRAYWIASSGDSDGWLYDVSGQGRVLAPEGAPEFGYDALIPYIEFDGSNDWLMRPDEPGLDILGTEVTVQAAYLGLTLGGWFYSDTSGATAYLMCKWGAADNRSYRLFANAGNTIGFSIENPASARDTATTTTTFADDTWYFAAGRFDPGNELKVWLNGDSVTNAVGIGASLRNSTAGFTVGADNAGASRLDGRFSQGFLCAMLLSDTQIFNYYEQTRTMYGV